MGEPSEEDSLAPPASQVVETRGNKTIRREVFVVKSDAPQKNPLASAHAETPANLNAVRVVRYRIDADPPLPARAVMVLVPGLLAGAPSYDALARAMVARSQVEGGETIEAWAIDRRPNLLEDHHGLDVAEVKKDPELARAYYFDGAPVHGKTFAGFVPPAEVAYLSEWGLPTLIADLKNVMALIPQAERKSRVVLVGHSLGASVVEEFAAWDFAGAPGYKDLAGLVMIDGGARVEGKAELPVSQMAYEVSGGGSGVFVVPGLQEIRKKAPYFSLPLLGLETYPVANILALRSALSPKDVVSDLDRDKALKTFLSLRDLPKMENRAAMGFAFGRQYTPLSIAAVTAGVATGGKIEAYQSPLGGTSLHPTDPNALYTWVEWNATNPPGNTDLAAFSRAFYEGPGIDFTEWYFPTRLMIDVATAATLTIPETGKDGDWPERLYGLRARHGADLDLPILGMVATAVRPGEAERFMNLRTLLGDKPIGTGRPLAGSKRDNTDAFDVVGFPEMTHIDPVAGADVEGSAAQRFYDRLLRFVTMSTPRGGVVVNAP